MHFRRDQVDAPQTGTCGWIWDHPSYKKWLWDENNESNILWIKGKAGSGKSTLAKTIQVSLSTTSDQPKLPSRTASPEILLSGDIYVPDESSVSNDIVVDFFYSGRAGLRARSPRWMLQSLLHQVLKQDPSAFDMIRHHYRRLGQGWSYDLLKTALAVAITASRSRSQSCISPRIYFLLDAADESQKEDTVERIDVIEFLANLSSQAASSGRILKLLLVSRTANDIQASLGRVNMIEMHQQTVKDVEKIVQQGMLSLSLQLRGISESPSSSDDDSDEANGARNLHSSRTNSGGITLQVDFWSSQQQNSKRNYVDDLRFVNDYLISNANGVILWVVLILKELRLALKVGFWTLNKIRELLTSLPKDLEHCILKWSTGLEQRGSVTNTKSR
jgi:energy-coupling factor transporter ATP-binding protein EcfA2